MQVPAGDIMQWFPFPHAREKQVKALDFVERAVGRGYRDIVIAAPTGIGKTGIGVTTALWGDAESLSSLEGEPGGYYLVTQKMLQDQLTQDFNKFITRFRAQSSSLKSSSEYTCQARGNCMAGGRAKPVCHARKNGGCPYRMAYDAFVSNPVALTNYAYFMTEKAHIGKFSPRRFMVLDECHTVEKQLLSFVDVSVGNTEMREWAPHIGKVPDLPSADDFCDWLESVYIACIKERMEMKLVQAQDSSDPRLHQQVQQLQNHYSRLRTAVHSLRNDPTNWVYWQELEEDGISLRSVAKPIEAAPFTHDLLTSSGSVRVYMSAYPGEKKVFCRSLGLDPATVAWCNLGSTFPVANRPIHLYYCGSMSRNNVGATLPNMLRMTGGIMRQHATEKGVIHCLDEKTRVLTDQGFKYHHELNGSESVYTLNDATGNIELEKPSAWVTKPWTGTMCSVRTRGLDMCVTPDHLVYCVPGRNGDKTALLEAHSLRSGTRVFGRKKAHVFKVPRTGKWHGNTFRLGPLSGLDGAAFVGWFMAEGCAYVTEHKGQKQYRVDIAQNSIESTEIPDLVRRCGFKGWVQKGCEGRSDAVVITNKKLCLLLRRHCYAGGSFDSHTKRIPNALRRSDPAYVREALRCMVEGDGSRSSNNGKRSGQPHAYYTTVSAKLAEDVVELCLKAGYASTFRCVDRARWKPSRIRGREIKRSAAWVVEIGTDSTRTVFRSGQMATENYSGTVFCPSTKNGIIFVERNGKTYWTGNCHTYKLGVAITDHFRGTPEGERLLFPKKANDRKHLLQHHLTSSEPTVLVSPSMTEGFSLDDEAARWQIIAKVAYPYLGDRQIKAKEQRDPEWYAMQAAMTAIQAAGRIVRSDTDWGATYILDSDFEGLINRHPEFFPLWFTSAFVRH